MTTLKEINDYGEELEKLMVLRTSPVAVKMLRAEGDIPEGAIRPKRDKGFHLAQCVLFDALEFIGCKSVLPYSGCFGKHSFLST